MFITINYRKSSAKLCDFRRGTRFQLIEHLDAKWSYSFILYYCVDISLILSLYQFHKRYTDENDDKFMQILTKLGPTHKLAIHSTDLHESRTAELFYYS